LTWVCFINKISSPLVDDKYQNVKEALKFYLEKEKHLHKSFLNVLFKWANSLGFNRS